MQLNIYHQVTIDILSTLATRLDLPIEEVVKLCVAWMDADKVLALGHKLSTELKLETTE